jgi:hypothetical protein
VGLRRKRASLIDTGKARGCSRSGVGTITPGPAVAAPRRLEWPIQQVVVTVTREYGSSKAIKAMKCGVDWCGAARNPRSVDAADNGRMIWS